MKADRVTTQLRKLAPRKATRLVMCGVGMDGGELETLGEWTLADYPGDALATLGEEVHQTAQYHCDETRRQTKYRALAYDKDGAEVNRFTLTQLPEPMEGETLAATELDEPSAQGLVAQAMRHQERQFNLVMSSQERVIRGLQDQIVRLEETVAKQQKRADELSDLARAIYERGDANGEAQERTASRIDRTLAILSEKILPAVGKEMGLLPADFSMEKDVGEYSGPTLSNEETAKAEAEARAELAAAEKKLGGNGKDSPSAE